VVAQGDLDLRSVLLVAIGAAVLGDQLGYWIGRRGGRRVVETISRRIRRRSLLRRAEAFTARWGAPSIFFSRWLVTALGPWVNLGSGVTHYAWPKFLLWDILGEVTWVTAYVALGILFSDQLHDVAQVVSNLGWLLLALLVAAGSGWELVRLERRARAHPRRAAH
jgi:membrane-associated protein